MEFTIMNDVFTVNGECDAIQYYVQEDMLSRGFYIEKVTGPFFEGQNFSEILSLVKVEQVGVKVYYFYSGVCLAPLQEQIMIKEILTSYKQNTGESFETLMKMLTEQYSESQIQREDNKIEMVMRYSEKLEFIKDQLACSKN